MTKTFIKIFIGIALVGSQGVMAAPAQHSNTFAVTNHYTIGGAGGWDLISFDAKHHHLFISRSSHVQVVDTETRKLVADIPNTNGVHGIAIADDLNLGFTSNGKSNSVTVFELDTLKVIDTIAISGENPDVILYEPTSKHIFTFNARSSTATVIDAASHKAIATITLPGRPELAVHNDAGQIFVNLEDKSAIAVIDAASNSVIKSYNLVGGEEPTGLAIDIAHHRLFSVCANHKMVIVDSDTGRTISTVNIGASPDSAGFDAELGVAFSSNGDGTVTIVKESDPEHFAVVQNVVSKKGARTMTYDAKAHIAYLVTASFGKTPEATTEHPKPRPELIADSFEVVEVSLKQ